MKTHTAMIGPIRLIAFTILASSLCLAPSTAGGTSTSPGRVERPATQADGPTDPQELEAYLDSVFTAQLQTYRIPGAVVAVVKDGELFFAKGYGYADLEQRKPVVADQTVFRIASVSKLFTWTAVMQLIEQGKLDLNADVNTYLKDFQLPATYPQPVTVVHLLTHTAGFEDRPSWWARGPDDLVPLGELLASNMPVRVRPPGEFTAYSNYGTVLAGYIVEQVSGLPFEQYIEDNILKSLGMQHSTFRQPLPPELAADMAVGYTSTNGTYRAESFVYLQDAPTGSMSATATDMAQFMIAHLQDGRHGNTRLLQEATAQEMHRQQFSHDPRVSGMTYGFFEGDFNGQRMILHFGDTGPFHSMLVLVPEYNVGLFVDYNSGGGVPARIALLQAFFDRYYPPPAAPEPRPLADSQERVARIAGSYRSIRTGYNSFIKLGSLFQMVSVSANPNGTLLITGIDPLDPQPTQWVEVEPLFFRPIGSQASFWGGLGLVFREDSQGRITHMFVGNNPTSAYERVTWYETPSFHFSLLVLCIAIFLSAVVAWPVGYLINRRKGQTGQPRLTRPRRARWLAWAVSALSLLSTVALLLAFLNLAELNYGASPLLIAGLVIALLTAALTVGLVVFAVWAWRGRYWRLAGRIHYTLVTLAALAFVWFLNYWNLLGFRF